MVITPPRGFHPLESLLMGAVAPTWVLAALMAVLLILAALAFRAWAAPSKSGAGWAVALAVAYGLSPPLAHAWQAGHWPSFLHGWIAAGVLLLLAPPLAREEREGGPTRGRSPSRTAAALALAAAGCLLNEHGFATLGLAVVLPLGLGAAGAAGEGRRERVRAAAFGVVAFLVLYVGWRYHLLGKRGLVPWLEDGYFFSVPYDALSSFPARWVAYFGAHNIAAHALTHVAPILDFDGSLPQDGAYWLLTLAAYGAAFVWAAGAWAEARSRGGAFERGSKAAATSLIAPTPPAELAAHATALTAATLVGVACGAVASCAVFSYAARAGSQLACFAALASLIAARRPR